MLFRIEMGGFQLNFLAFIASFAVLNSAHAEDPTIFQNATTGEWITLKGYPLETHEIQTKDGYILTYFRIPHGKLSQHSGKASNGPVLLQHGIVGSSFDWFTQDEDKTFPFLLAERGYDVWIGNARGTGYSNKHIKFSSKDKNYWNFCWEDMGMYDIPAGIDYILTKTEEKNLHYIGYSMGTTQFFVMAALKPEYNSKVKLMSAFAPVAYMKNVKNELIRKIKPLLHFVKSKFGRPVGEFPNTSSFGSLVHYGQEIVSNKFARFDFGPANLWKYKSISPPSFDEQLITVPIAFYSGSGDDLSTPENVAYFGGKLPKLVRNYIVPRQNFTHLDFVRATDAFELVYSPAMELMESF